MVMQAVENNSLEVREESHLFDIAHWAAGAYASFTRDQVEKIVNAVAEGAAEKAEFYAEWAVRETGFGDVASKAEKNILNSTNLIETHRISDYIECKLDEEKKILKYPKPAGVVVALVPSTNPVATVFYKAISCLMTRNAVILCPHPSAVECCVHAADYLAGIAERANAPRGVIQIVRKPSVPLVNELMRSKRTDLILATGGPAMVRAAYSSGNPAIGVGPGNVACYVHASADIDAAAERIVRSKSFDNSLPCTCESVIVADEEIGDRLGAALVKSGAHHVEHPEAEARLREFLFPEGKMNPKAIGKSAGWIAEQAGIGVKPGTRVLGVEIFKVGVEEPLSKEKMFPVLGFIKVKGIDSAIRVAQGMLRMHGAGHSAVIHSKEPYVVARWGRALPVCRIAVNAPGVLGSSGMVTNITPGAVIGTGFFGRSSISENVGPKHLIQWTHIAYNRDPVEIMGDMDAALSRINTEYQSGNQPVVEALPGDSGPGAPGRAPYGRTQLPGADPESDYSEIRSLIRELLAEELKAILRP